MVKETSSSSTSCSASSSSMANKTSYSPPSLSRILQRASNEMESGIREMNLQFRVSSALINPSPNDEFKRDSGFRKKNRTTPPHDQTMTSLAEVNGDDLLLPGNNLFETCLKDLDSRQNKILSKRPATHGTDLATDDSDYASLIENAPNPCKKELLLKITDNAAYLSQGPKGTIPMDKRFTRGATLQGSSQLPRTHSTDDSEFYKKELYLNKNLVNFTVTKNEVVVQAWISTHVIDKKIKKIGISVESDVHEMADVITLYVFGECLIYRVTGISVCDHMVTLLKSDAYLFGGKKGVRRLITSKLLSDQQGHLIMNTGETIPNLIQVEAAHSYNKRHNAALSWMACSLTVDQIKMSGFEAQLGWVMIPCSPTEAQMIMRVSKKQDNLQNNHHSHSDNGQTD